MRLVFKWLFRLLILAIALVVAGVLLLNTIVKALVQSRLRSQTGMEVQIGKIDVGLTTPTIAVENLKIYNTAEFGGSLLLNVPELYVEYDKDALRDGRLHVKLVRLNIAEIDVVQDKQGRLNINGLEEKSKEAKAATAGHPSGWKFTGVDTLNLTFQKLRISSLDKPGQAEEVNFNLANQVFPNIKSEADLEGMAIVLAGRGAVSAAAAPPGAPPVDMQKVLMELLKH
jgi:uncharacterized protein involved in outer membrane biogenesis